MARQPDFAIDPAKNYMATITLDTGAIVMELDPSIAPSTVNNFVSLARNGFYDGLNFHRVVDNFVVQGGCPTGTGTGGPGYSFRDEPVMREYLLGAVAMANSGPNSNGSQFFICTVDCRNKLQKLYNLFGFVREGMDVVLGVKQGDVMRSITVEEVERDQD